MNWKTLLAAMSGPIGSAVRYGVTVAGTYAATKWGIDGDTVSAVSAGIVAAATAGLGMLTASAPVKTQAVANLPDVAAVKKTDGTTVFGQ